MNIRSSRIPYRQTGFFSDLVLNYLDRNPELDSFYTQPVSRHGIDAAIEKRKAAGVDRKLLTATLQRQYAGMPISARLQQNLEKLSQENCFTITTAHQNNLFTGPLYFIYKILHVIKLASHLEQTAAGNHFVPVFYMGSEDADLAELDHATMDGVRYQWKTPQSGAVGRMKVDDELIRVLRQVEAQLSGLPRGRELIQLLQEAYRLGKSVAEATFFLVNQLFGQYGLVVLIPDNTMLKAQFKNIMADELLKERASKLVGNAADKLLQAGYKVQANPRSVNLFYLTDELRQRIEKDGTHWVVQGSSVRFDQNSLLKELDAHPERFSPNVILRGLYQCSILPDVAFVGGGGELSYWLEFRGLFEYYKVPMPVLILRNSFLLLESSDKEKLNKLQLNPDDLFADESVLAANLLTDEEHKLANIQKEKDAIQQVYAQLVQKANAIDLSLAGHTAALEKKSLQGLEGLEKKLIRSLKRRHASEQNQLLALTQKLFPGGNLQERHDNVLPYVAKYGQELLEALLEHSLNLEQEFTVIEIA